MVLLPSPTLFTGSWEGDNHWWLCVHNGRNIFVST